MTKLEILEKEHELIADAFGEWILTLEHEELNNGLGYIEGVNELADILIKGEKSAE